MTAKYDPGQVRVSVLGDGAYFCTTNNEPLHVPSPEDFKDLHAWTMDLTDPELEAALQIYYDRWMFQSGADCDRLAFEAIEHERDRRCLDTSTWAPGIFA